MKISYDFITASTTPTGVSIGMGDLLWVNKIHEECSSHRGQNRAADHSWSELPVFVSGLLNSGLLNSGLLKKASCDNLFKSYINSLSIPDLLAKILVRILVQTVEPPVKRQSSIYNLIQANAFLMVNR